MGFMQREAQLGLTAALWRQGSIPLGTEEHPSPVCWPLNPQPVLRAEMVQTK